MKRCPECRRDYYNGGLLHCLDDGTALLDDPAFMDEPVTAVYDVLPSGEVGVPPSGGLPPADQLII